MDPIPLPAPFGGVNQQLPIIAVQSPQCENLFNFNVTSDGVVLRNGDSKFAAITAGTPGTNYCLIGYGSSKVFAATRNTVSGKLEIIDVEANTIVFTSAASIDSTVVQPLYFNRYLFFFADGNYAPGAYYNGSAYGVIGYTGATTFKPIGGDVFKNRAYLIQKGESAYWYTGINSITGSTTKVDLSTVVSEESTLSIIAPVTISDTVSTVTLQCFIFNSGEILFYSGSYPNSSDWTLIGRARIGAPLNYQSYIDYQGDSLVLCDTGVASLRDLFLKGSEEGADLTLSSNAQDNWNALVQAIRAALGAYSNPFYGVRGIWDPKTNRIIISFPKYLDSSSTLISGSYYFVFYTQLKSWFFQRSFGTIGDLGQALSIYDITRYKNKVLFMSEPNTTGDFLVWQKEGATGFTDRNALDTAELGYDFDIKSAPIANGRAYVQKGEGMDVILETDLESVTNYQLIGDLGVQTTTAQKLPDIPTGVQKPYINMGIEASYIQYKISGTTTTGKTVGLKLYGTNFWQQIGESPR